MIQFLNINKRFNKLQVLKDINLTFEKRNIIALIGPNASGKTTLIKTLLGMIIPDSGRIIFDYESIENNWAYRKKIGYMPQIGRYPENMTVGQVIGMIEGLRKEEHIALDRTLYHEFQLKAILNKRMRALSGGTRQKVSAYLAFLFNSPVIVLDEPTAGLDPLSSFILKKKILWEKEKGKTILITSHILSELDEIVNRIIYLEEGQVLFDKELDQLKIETHQDRLSEAIAYLMNQREENTPI